MYGDHPLLDADHRQHKIRLGDRPRRKQPFGRASSTSPAGHREAVVECKRSTDFRRGAGPGWAALMLANASPGWPGLVFKRYAMNRHQIVASSDAHGTQAKADTNAYTWHRGLAGTKQVAPAGVPQCMLSLCCAGAVRRVPTTDNLLFYGSR